MHFNFCPSSDIAEPLTRNGMSLESPSAFNIYELWFGRNVAVEQRQCTVDSYN